MPAPNSPAPVSGPGALSKRTDGGPAQKLMDLPDAKYGENATYMGDQRGAPLAQSPTPQAAPAGPPSNPAADNVVPFSEPSQRPGEPVTSGAAMGAGPGVEALGLHPQQVESGDMQTLGNYLPVLQMIANMPNASPGSRMFVNLLQANQGSSPPGPSQGPGAPPIPMGGPSAQ
jgi:hypothetical protein